MNDITLNIDAPTLKQNAETLKAMGRGGTKTFLYLNLYGGLDVYQEPVPAGVILAEYNGQRLRFKSPLLSRADRRTVETILGVTGES